MFSFMEGVLRLENVFSYYSRWCRYCRDLRPQLHSRRAHMYIWWCDTCAYDDVTHVPRYLRLQRRFERAGFSAAQIREAAEGAGSLDPMTVCVLSHVLAYVECVLFVRVNVFSLCYWMCSLCAIPCLGLRRMCSLCASECVLFVLLNVFSLCYPMSWLT